MVEQPSPIRVLLVDDEDIVRYGLNAMLKAETAIEVVGEAQDGLEAINQANALAPDVVLMDISMPVMDGIRATREIAQTRPQTKIIVLTTHAEDDYLVAAMQEGAAGYLLKNTPPEDFVLLIQAAHKGYLQLSPSMAQKLTEPKLTEPKLTEQFKLDTAKPMALNGAAVHSEKPLSLATASSKGITPREQDVLRLISEGASNREIAQILHIAEKTVKNHVSNLLKRVELRDRTQLAIWANTAQT
ncbi:MAG: response regulator transcription factor [Cyanobacteria bacterium P01_A01_bin.116]